jgi:fatty acid desaturase
VAGLLAPQPLYYWIKSLIAVATLAAVVAIAVVADNPWIVLLDAVLFGIATTQTALLAHDIGHRQAFRSRKANRLASLFFGNMLLGISYTWWLDKHNKHHATPNSMEDDPDVNFPMLVFDSEQIAAKHRAFRPIIAIQAYLFVLFLPLQAIGMRVGSVEHLLRGKARMPLIQAFAMGSHFALFAILLIAIGSWPVAIGFAVISQVTWGLYNSSVFASNHKGMAIIKPGERMDFLHEQVLTSRNVDGHRLTDFWYGGLNYQIEHHLFPTMPRNRLAEAQVIVRQFCAEEGIAYYSTSLLASYREVFSHLNKVSAPLRGG